MGLLPKHLEGNSLDRDNEVWVSRVPFLLDPDGNFMVGSPGDWHSDFDAEEIRARFGLRSDQDPSSNTSAFRGFAMVGGPGRDDELNWPIAFREASPTGEPGEAIKQTIRDHVRANCEVWVAERDRRS